MSSYVIEKQSRGVGAVAASDLGALPLRKWGTRVSLKTTTVRPIIKTTTTTAPTPRPAPSLPVPKPPPPRPAPDLRVPTSTPPKTTVVRRWGERATIYGGKTRTPTIRVIPKPPPKIPRHPPKPPPRDVAPPKPPPRDVAPRQPVLCPEGMIGKYPNCYEPLKPPAPGSRIKEALERLAIKCPPGTEPASYMTRIHGGPDCRVPLPKSPPRPPPPPPAPLSVVRWSGGGGSAGGGTVRRHAVSEPTEYMEPTDISVPVTPPVDSKTKTYLLIGGAAVVAGLGVWLLTRKRS